MNTARGERVALVAAPHTDDAELGCGGTIARLVEEGWEVHVAVFSTCVESLPAGMDPDTLRLEFLAAAPRLGLQAEHLHIREFPVRKLSYHRQEVLEDLVDLRARIRPNLVFIPSGRDMHQDHQVVCAEGTRAFKQEATLLGYELPWNNLSFDAQAFFWLGESHLAKKMDALGCYRSQIGKNRQYFDPEFITGWARFRGLQIGQTYAEVFEVMRVLF